MHVELIQTQRFKFINYCPILVDDSKQFCILIDPSWERQKFIQFIEANRLQVLTILLTHHHLDHSHLANYFAKKYEIPVYMSSAEIEYYGFHCSGLKAIPPNHRVLNFPHFPSLLVHPTPGHTFGGVCYQMENSLFTGDSLFNEGCGICHSKGGDPSMMFDSLEYLKAVIANQVLIYPGHRFHSALGQCFEEIKKMNIYLNIEDKEEFIRFRSRKTKSLLGFL